MMQNAAKEAIIREVVRLTDMIRAAGLRDEVKQQAVKKLEELCVVVKDGEKRVITGTMARPLG